MQDTPTDNKLLQLVWDYMSIETPLRPSDVIIVGGCKNIELARYAAKLYREKYAPIIVFSGHAQPDMTTTEADLLANVALDAGVPASAILRERYATNTGENVTLSAKLLEERGIVPASVILIHQPFMSRRFLATAEAQWSKPQPAFITRHEEISLAAYSHKHGHERTAHRTLESFGRMEAYASHGFQSIHPIPQVIKNAHDALVSRNYQIR
jgi:uncharacterized SAM-binding protein YcdF (DUF218 family)